MDDEKVKDGNSPRIITLTEASKMLCCSYSTALRLVRDGELKAFRVRGAWRTSIQACEEYIEKAFGDQATNAEGV